MKKIILFLIAFVSVNCFAKVTGVGANFNYSFRLDDNGEETTELKEFYTRPFFRYEFNKNYYIEPFIFFSYREEFEDRFVYESYNGYLEDEKKKFSSSSIGLGTLLGKYAIQNKYFNLNLGVNTGFTMELMPRGEGAKEYDEYLSFYHGSSGEISFELKVTDTFVVTFSHFLLGYNYSFKSTKVDDDEDEETRFSISAVSSFNPSVGFYIRL